MVQRKVSCKLGIHADQAKTNTLFINHKPGYVQQQDVKNRSADLTKKMKKSGSNKRQDNEKPNLKRQVVLPGKPPPSDAVPTRFATPQKKAPIRACTDTTPNYMKATSSSDARKEKFQVSSKTGQTSPDITSLARTNSSSFKHGSTSGAKAARTLSRISSVKLTRSWTKTPSFKPARPVAKKCPPVMLCENLDIERATCSSTLKDSKFPAYLTLNPGGTELEGTSAMKVCPYTYCSLNGHRHAPGPPLKPFLQSRRLMIKTQRSIKLGCLSPRRVKPVQAIEDVSQQDEFNNPTISPLIQEEHDNFFIEIYGMGTESTAGSDNETVVKYDEIHDEESQSEGNSIGRIGSHENPDKEGDVNSTLPSMSKQEIKQGSLNDQADITEELDSEASDMDWVAGDSSEVVSCIIVEESFCKVDDYFDDMPAEEVVQQSFDEESWSSDAWFDEEDGESTSSNEYLEIFDTPFTSPLVEDTMEKPEIAIEDESDGEEIYEYPTNENWSETGILPTFEDAEADGRLEEIKLVGNADDDISKQAVPNMPVQTDQSYEEQQFMINQNKNQDFLEEDFDQAEKEPQLSMGGPNLDENENYLVQDAEVEDATMPSTEDPSLKRTASTMKIDNAFAGNNLQEDFLSACKTLRERTRCKRPVEDCDESRLFNPRAPNFLPLEPDPEAEKVDLKHQMMDERRNSEEWMLDYALRNTVNKLAPARKRKVALLVEAFEAVLPTIKCERHLPHNSAAFGHVRPIQACN